MAHRVIWSDDAVEDLQQISDYIARDSGHYARVVVRGILERFKTDSCEGQACNLQFAESQRFSPFLEYRWLLQTIVICYSDALKTDR